MKVRIAFTKEFPDKYRRALNLYMYGEEGLASREDIIEHVRLYGTSVDDDMMYELQLEESGVVE